MLSTIRDVPQPIKIKMGFEMYCKLVKDGFDQAPMVQRLVTCSAKLGDEPAAPGITRKQTMQIAPSHPTID